MIIRGRGPFWFWDGGLGSCDCNCGAGAGGAGDGVDRLLFFRARGAMLILNKVDLLG